MADIIDSLVLDRTAEDVEEGNIKGQYGINDLNRIEAAVQFVADKIVASGGIVSVQSGPAWEYSSSITPSQMSRFLQNIKNIRNTGLIFEDTPQAPGSISGLTYEGANSIEQILWDVNSVIEKRSAVYIESGMATAYGGSNLYIPTISTYRPTTTMYIVTVIGGTGSGLYRTGDTVEITANVPAGSHLVKWEGDVALDDPTAETTTFAMPAANVTVTANYNVTAHTITVGSTTGGTAFASKSSAEMGEIITLSHVAASTDYLFDQWLVLSGGVTVTNNQFTMPDNDVEIRAVFNSSIIYLPTIQTSLTYRGTMQSPDWVGYDSSKMTITGDLAGENAGAYTTLFTPLTGYKWDDDSTGTKYVIWSIEKAAPSAVVLSDSTVTLDNHHRTITFTVTRDGDGIISAVSSDTSVCTVFASGNVVTVESVHDTSGSATITVSVGEGANYLAPPNVTCSLTAVFVPEYTITASVEPAGSGIISGAGTYAQGDTVTLAATGTGNYGVMAWMENGSVVSEDSIYTFTASGNRSLLVQMTLIPAEYTELPYIYNTGYILCPIGISANSDSIITVDAKINDYYGSGTTYKQFIMAYTAQQSTWYQAVYVRNNYTTLYLANGTGTGSASTVSVDYRQRLHFIADFSAMKLSVKTTDETTEYSNTASLIYFWTNIGVPYHASTTAYTLANIYDITAKYKSTGELYANLVPVQRKSDSVVGYYDTIGRRFITPATGTFRAGTN